MMAERAAGCAGAGCSSASLGGTKAGLALALTLEGAACAALAPWLGRRAKLTRMANAFAAGVFIASALVHTLPHAAEIFAGGHEEEHAGRAAGQEQEGHAEAFPTTNVIALAALLALVFLETVLLGRFSHGSHGHANSCHSDVPSDDDGDGDDEENEEDAAVGENDRVLEYVNGHAKDTDADVEADGSWYGAVSDGKGMDADYMAATTPPLFSSDFCIAAVPVLAIAVHSLLESISFGLTTAVAAALPIFAAIAAHRWIVATAVLAKLASAKELRRLQRAVLFTGFVLVTPLGTAIGVGLTALPTKVEGVLVAVSGGAFLYLGLEGIFAEMVHHAKWKGRKFGALLLGAGLIVVVNGVLVAADVHHG